MAKKAKLTKPLTVGFTVDWFNRVAAVADHDRTQVAMAEVIRDCVEAALPGFELALGIRTLDDLDDQEVLDLGLERKPEPPAPGREDRSAGLFGGPPKQG